MTRKDPELSIPLTVSLIADYEDFKAFKKLVGDQNVSKEIRAMIRDRVNLQKNEQAQLVDPLRLQTYGGLDVCINKDRQSSLFETFVLKDSRDDMVKLVRSIPDIQTLNKLDSNLNCMVATSKTLRKELRK